MTARARQLLTALLGIVLALVVLGLGIWLGGHPDKLPSGVRSSLVGDSDTQVVREALDDVHADYFRPIDRKALSNAAVAGIVRSLGDRFSNYFTPTEYKRFQQVTDAQFSGVGLAVARDPRGLRVVEVYDGSPAKHAGLAPGDIVLAVNGKSLKGVSEKVSTALIRGTPGTSVRLTFLSGKRRVTRPVARATVSVPVVTSHPRTAPGGAKVQWVTLSTFSSGAHGEVRQAVDRALAKGAKGIVLDLRHNGGGLVDEARLIASIFVPEGVIVSTRGRTQPSRTLTATGGAISTKIPVVVLVDADTASAAEIVTGALQDHHRATVVGTKTFGKGVFQEVKTLGNGGALDITVGRYYTPNGHNLGGVGVKQGAGIKPDVRASDNPKTPKRDEGLDAALRVLGSKIAAG